MLYRLSYVGGRGYLGRLFLNTPFELQLYGRAAKPRLNELERVVGIEPTSSAWKAEVLPLNYTRLVMTLK